MSLIKNLYNLVLDALFPLSPIEEELFSYSPEKAYSKLPPAPPPPLSDIHSIFAYKDERVAKLVWNIKYKKSAQAVAIGGYALLQGLTYKALLGRRGLPVILVPMPITPRRRRERGYNQCELLIYEIGRLDTEKRFRICSDLLIRTQHTSRQTLKGRAERLEDAKGIFSVKDSRDITSTSPIIVIDDVITTGSTMKEAIETLKKAGFENITGLSLAH